MFDEKNILQMFRCIFMSYFIIVHFCDFEFIHRISRGLFNIKYKFYKLFYYFNVIFVRATQ